VTVPQRVLFLLIEKNTDKKAPTQAPQQRTNYVSYIPKILPRALLAQQYTVLAMALTKQY
jgi:hypothetical protein